MVQSKKAEVRKNWANFCQKINDTGELVETPIHHQDGTVTTRVHRKKIICDGAHMTGYSILMMFAKSNVKKTKEINSLKIPQEHQDHRLVLSTNSPAIAKFRGNISARTIRNHVDQLIEVGLIVEKKFHGSKSNYKLILNSDIVFGKDATIMTEFPVFEAPSTTHHDESRFCLEAQTSTAQPVFDTTFLEQKNVNFKARKNDTNSLNSLIFPHKPTIETNRNLNNTISNNEFPLKKILQSEESSNMETIINRNPPSAIPQKMPLNAEIKGGAGRKTENIQLLGKKNRPCG